MPYPDRDRDPDQPPAEDSAARSKISPGFAARLEALPTDEPVRAIVLLDTISLHPSSGKRQSYEERQAAIEVTRRAAEIALPEIDEILNSYGGGRLAEQPDLLGSIPVETTAAGVMAPAESGWVKLIVEDQGISLVY